LRIRTVLVSAPAVVVPAVLAVVFAAALTVLLPAPAGAQAEPCPPGQPTGRPPGTPPGPGAAPAQPTGRPPQYPPGKCQLRLSRSVVAAGESVGIAGDGFAPGAQVRMAAAGRTLATVAADAGGSFSTDVVIPASLAPGTHEVTASGAAAAGGTQVLAASLTVTGAASRSDTAGLGGALPRTGGDGIVPMTIAGSGLLAVGTSAVVAARRRRTQPGA
jgi:LPXTG-motif cell wall-anchored protein